VAKILIVEDEQSMRDVLRILLEGEGHEIAAASDGAEGLDLIRKDIFDLVVTDLRMPGADGFEILRATQEVAPETMVIMMTAFGTIESAIEAMKLGAYDYVHKPFKIDEIRLIVRNALDKRKLKTEVSLLREQVATACEVDNIIGRSPKMREVLGLLPKIARNSANVLITGESGTGKDLVAQALHNLSPRRDRSFVAINCASFPEGLLESEIFGHMKGAFTGAVQNKQGLFEIADGGTMFLDEVAEMPPGLQSKLLRAIENGTFRRLGGTTDITVNARIVAATNKDLREEVRAGAFREDLYFRLNVIPLHLPPLRERREDIPLLLDHFLAKYSDGKTQFSGSAMERLMGLEWRGNVRELENVVERILLLTDKGVITESDLPADIVEHQAPSNGGRLPEARDGMDLEGTMAGLEKKYLMDALAAAGGRKTEAARLLNISFRSFRHKLSKYGIK